MSDPFADPRPPGSGGPTNEELAGKLLMLSVNGIERGIQTTAGVSDAVRCVVADLATGERHEDTLLWGRVLVTQFEAGKMYVGRLGKGVAQPGKSAPWVFHPGDDADKSVASRYLAHVQGNSQQAAPAATPAPAFTPEPAPAMASTSGSKPPWEA